jgi:FKBP12-rapamycin complex-associated protein
MEASDMWIKFANLCRKSDRLDLAAKTLNSLLGQSSPGGNESVSLHGNAVAIVLALMQR